MDETRPFAGIEVVEFGQFIAVLAPPVRLDGEGFRPQPATPAFGSQTRAILGELGFPEAEITSLLEAGVTRDTRPIADHRRTMEPGLRP